MTVIDKDLGYVYTKDSLPAMVGWEYRLMGRGDDYVTIQSIDGKYVTVKGISGVDIEERILLTAFDNIVKEVVKTGVTVIETEDHLYYLTTENDKLLLLK